MHADSAEDHAIQKQVEKKFGSTYLHYKASSYYFDLLDMIRRLCLTGILILVGGKDVSQLFIGILVSVFWVALLAYNRPYGAYWDNFITIMLAVHLTVTLISGMALKLFDSMNNVGDESEKVALGKILVIISYISFFLSTFAIVASTSCIRDRLDKCVEKDEEEEEEGDDDEEKEGDDDDEEKEKGGNGTGEEDSNEEKEIELTTANPMHEKSANDTEVAEVKIKEDDSNKPPLHLDFSLPDATSRLRSSRRNSV